MEVNQLSELPPVTGSCWVGVFLSAIKPGDSRSGGKVTPGLYSHLISTNTGNVQMFVTMTHKVVTVRSLFLSR